MANNAEGLKRREGAVELFAVYGPLLTPSQQKMMREYYDFDLSLAEIAEENGVSRAAVSEALKTSLQKMEEYEKKLSLLAKRSRLLSEIAAAEEKEGEERLKAYQAIGKEIKHGI